VSSHRDRVKGLEKEVATEKAQAASAEHEMDRLTLDVRVCCLCVCNSVVGSDYTIPRFRATCREAQPHETNIYPCLTHHHRQCRVMWCTRLECWSMPDTVRAWCADEFHASRVLRYGG
jgi:hypothetical protein